ncbi:hypothetical protein ANCCAN_20492 [Ancylostoma caninum]|uniref:Uncharacterized protein n=1 Tax=Ancylostoma caninum TaxID=29170 RepID=A0A368FQ67_ANCCA|nr:hypothetical protein ANCCAN_20492 [Ancylostoma caninum]
MSRRSRGTANSRASTQGSDHTFENGPTVNFEEMMDAMNEADRDTGERLRRHLQFFFMNPLEKWKVRVLSLFCFRGTFFFRQINQCVETFVSAS